MRALAALNRAKMREIADLLTAFCRTPLPFEALLRQLFSHYGLEMDMSQYALVGSTVRSYLTYLKAQGRLTARCEDGRLLWCAAP